jgi:hypothetical protein
LRHACDVEGVDSTDKVHVFALKAARQIGQAAFDVAAVLADPVTVLRRTVVSVT